MNARLKVYRQLQRQAQIIRAGKDPEAAIVAAEEEIAYSKKIAEEERRENQQRELFNVVHEDDELPIAASFSTQPGKEGK